MIASKEYVLKALEKKALFPKKHFSQNFLIDEQVARDIVNLLDIKENDNVIEIGPGLGALSEIILEQKALLFAYEIDERMCEHLRATFSMFTNFNLIDGDFLKQRIDNKKECKVISNLPYAITTPLIEKTILEIDNCKTFVFMVQKEVSERLFAKVNTKEYSPLAIILQHVGILKKEIVVTKNNFFPIPNIDSMVFSLSLKERDIKFDQKFYKFLKLAFAMRRKTLVNNLSKYYQKDKVLNSLNKLNLIESIRPEQIKYEEFLILFHDLTTQI